VKWAAAWLSVRRALRSRRRLAGEGCRGFGGGDGAISKLARRGLLLCRLSEDRLKAYRLTPGSKDVRIQQVRPDSGGWRRRTRRCPTAALLAKSDYLVRVLETPVASPGEVRAALSLQAEATLPAEYGQVEISYRPLKALRTGYGRYEVYIARREALEGLLARLREVGLEPDWILPSAVIWGEILTDGGELHMLVAAGGAGSDREVALRGTDHALSVRTIRWQPAASGLLSRELRECIRSLLPYARRGSEPVRVGWIGRGCPRESLNGTVHFREISPAGVGGATEDADAMLTAAASVLPALAADRRIVSTNMLPKATVAVRQIKKVFRRLSAATAGVLLSLMLLQAALEVSMLRYRRSAQGLAERISSIRAEGQTIGRRIEQLRAIRAARQTNRTFQRVLAGLYEATPEGVTYSQVDVGPEGDILLRGQAESLAMPFLLPERLEAQPVFEQVLLQDAGQVKKAGGSVTEFRIDCRLVRDKAS